MKRWGFAVAGLYLAALVVFSFPLVLAAFWPKTTVAETLSMYRSWVYWAWVAVMVGGELLLLLVPIRHSEQKLRGRRPLLVPIIASGLFLALLVLLCAWTISLGIWGDAGITFGLPDKMFWIVIGGAILLLWSAWAILFHRFTKADPPEALIKRATAWLLKGSILELLVAVPCHVAVRRRNDCCAPIGTFIGIAAGLSIMLLSFGPGVFLLFVERCRKLAQRRHDVRPQSEGDLPKPAL
jgi:hypothetical protein